MIGNWSNPKWDKALLTMMKRHPENITMCPNCGHFTIDKRCGTNKGYVTYHTSMGHHLDCRVCSMKLSGKRYVRWCDDVTNAMKHFFKEIGESNYTVEKIRAYIFNSKRIFYVPHMNNSFTLK